MTPPLRQQTELQSDTRQTAILAILGAMGAMFLAELSCLAERKWSKTTIDLPLSMYFPSR
jgi:hypothetical protein